MSALASLSMEAPADSVGLVLHDVRTTLRGEPIADVSLAVRIGAMSIAGCSPAEIRLQLGLTVGEFQRLCGLLRRAVRPTV